MNKIIVANFKMNFTKDEINTYIDNIKHKIKDLNLDLIICPSYLYLDKFKDLNCKLGSQNMFYEDQGSYTGEISGLQLKSLGVSYSLIGHSERRIHLKEDDIIINKKIRSCFKNNIIPILCIGESLHSKNNNMTYEVLKKQLLNGLKDISNEHIANIIIAYEPIWAIGSGKTPPIEDIYDIIIYIKNIIKKQYHKDIKVLYGGSVDKNNINILTNNNYVDGVLVGSSSLKARHFLEMLDLIKS